MKKRSIIVLTLLAGCFTNSFAQKGEKDTDRRSQ